MSTRARAGVAVALAAALAVGAAPSSTANSSTATHGSATTGLGATTRGWLSQAIESGRVRAHAAATSTGSGTPGGRTKASSPGAERAAAAVGADDAPACEGGVAGVDQLTDRTIVDFSLDGAATVSVLRRRNFGSWLTLGTVAGPVGQFPDLTINPRTSYLYRVVAKSTAGVTLVDCAIGSPRGAMGIWTNDGWGEPDAVLAAGNGGLRESASLDDGVEVVGGAWATPSYSADGRLVAATLVDGTTGAGVLMVLSARTGGKVFTVDPGPDVFAGEAAFSSNGQFMAFARYDATTGAPLGLGVVDVHGSHVVHLLSPDRPLAEPTWKPDNRTLVATDLTDGGGLVTLCSTCSATAPISGTTGGYTAEVAPDGRIWFGWADDNSSELRLLTGVTVTTVRQEVEAGWVWSMPRLLPDGRLFVKVDKPGGGEPGAFTSVVAYVGPSPDWDQQMWLGQGIGGFVGYDLRQPQGKGSSDFVNTPFDDLLAKDASGTLWAYQGAGLSLNGRVKIGSGWNGYVAFLAVGDLTSDDRADLLGKDSSGRLWLYAGLGAGRFGARTQIGSGFAPYTLVAPGDLNGDDLADLVAKDSAGSLWLYPGRGTGALSGRVKIGSGWNVMTSVLSSDVNADAKSDLVARSRDGKLWVYPGTGSSTGRLGKATQIGSGWGSFTALAVTEVNTKFANVWARSSAGVLYGYDICGDGRFCPAGTHTVGPRPYPLGRGWNGLVLSS